MPARRMNPGFQGGGDGVVMHSGKMKDAMVRALQNGVLSLSGRGLAKLPDEFEALDQLEYDNKTWWQEADVTKLDLSNNKLGGLPVNIAELPMLGALQVVNISDNALAELPGSLFRMPHLMRLHAMRNQLRGLPDDVGAAMNLQEIDLSDNPLVELPLAFGNLHRLATLKMTRTHLTALPESIGGCSGLQQLDLSDNRLTALPEGILLLAKLVDVELACNKIREFPVFSPSAPITRLSVRQNQLAGRVDVCGLAALRDLVVSFNTIESLWIVGSEGIATVDVRDNQLRDVEWALDLPQLKHLNVSNNNLTGLPPQLARLADLTTLNVEGNPIRAIRREVLSKGCVEILKYLKSRDTADATAPTQADIARENRANGLLAKQHYDLSRKPHVAPLSSIPLDAFQSVTGFGGGDDGVGITTFKCNGHQLDSIPEEIGLYFTRLAALELQDNRIATAAVPESFRNLGGSLASLSLKKNRIPACPALHAVPQLTHLDLSINRIRGGVDFRYLAHLDTLVLNDNELAAFPALPPSVSVLSVAGNQLVEVPEDLPLLLPKLTSLDLTNNSVAVVPANIGTMRGIRSLLLHGNPLKTIRRAMLDKGTDALLAYLRDRMDVAGAGAAQHQQQPQQAAAVGGAPGYPPRGAGGQHYQQQQQQQQQQQPHLYPHPQQQQQQPHYGQHYPTSQQRQHHQQQQHYGHYQQQQQQHQQQQRQQQHGHYQQQQQQQQQQPARAAPPPANRVNPRMPTAAERSGGGKSSIQFF